MYGAGAKRRQNPSHNKTTSAKKEQINQQALGDDIEDAIVDAFLHDLENGELDFAMKRAFCTQIEFKKENFARLKEEAMDELQQTKNTVEALIHKNQIQPDRQGEFRAQHEPLQAQFKVVTAFEAALFELGSAKDRVKDWYKGNKSSVTTGRTFLKQRGHLMQSMKELRKLQNQPELVRAVLHTVIAFFKDPISVQHSLLNFYIVGPPGTGKTEMGRAIANVLAACGIFSRDTMSEKKRPDLIGQYVGQTAPLTQNSLVTSLDGVVFIDEAYGLCELDDKGRVDSYGQEFATTLVKFMTDYKGMYGMIVAGYEDRMRTQFLAANEGIKSRFPYKYKISQLSAKLLLKIFNNNFASGVWEGNTDFLDAGARRRFVELIEALRGEEEKRNFPKMYELFENQARTMTVLAEDARKLYALQLQNPEMRNRESFGDYEKCQESSKFTVKVAGAPTMTWDSVRGVLEHRIRATFMDVAGDAIKELDELTGTERAIAFDKM